MAGKVLQKFKIVGGSTREQIFDCLRLYYEFQCLRLASENPLYGEEVWKIHFSIETGEVSPKGRLGTTLIQTVPISIGIPIVEHKPSISRCFRIDLDNSLIGHFSAKLNDDVVGVIHRKEKLIITAFYDTNSKLGDLVFRTV